MINYLLKDLKVRPLVAEPQVYSEVVLSYDLILP